MKGEEQRLLSVVAKWENVDRSKAAVALKALDKLWPEMEAAEALLVVKKKPPKLSLAKPPACGIKPLALEAADVAHAVGAAVILRGVDLELKRGQRAILRGPNGAGKSTLLKALSGALPLAAGKRVEDERLRLGVFAQDLAQELPQGELALSYVEQSVRAFDPTITSERCRTVMGSLGLVGEKSTRPIGTLSGGEKARVALATFCLTPYNVLLLDEPTNHLDVDAIAALLDAIETYTGAVVVISHDRPFCEALRATHVGYVCGGSCLIEERELRDSDFSEVDRGVRNTFVAGEGAAPPPAGPPPPSAAEVKAEREAEQKAYKLQNSAPKKLARLEAKVAEAEAALEARGVQMVAAGADVGKLAELDEAQRAQQAEVDGWYAEMLQLEAELEEIAAERASAAKKLEDVFNLGLTRAPPPPPPPPPPPMAASSQERGEARAAVEAAAKAAKVQKQQEKKKKFSKREKEEYATIEAEIDVLEAAAVKAEAELEEAKLAKPRLPQMQLLALAGAGSDARRAADAKMNRYIELEEMLEGS